MEHEVEQEVDQEEEQGEGQGEGQCADSESESSIDEDEIMVILTSGFSVGQKMILRKALYIGGRPPASITNGAIDLAMLKWPLFGRVYNRLVEVRGSRHKVNNSIRKSLCPKVAKKKLE